MSSSVRHQMVTIDYYRQTETITNKIKCNITIISTCRPWENSYKLGTQKMYELILSCVKFNNNLCMKWILHCDGQGHSRTSHCGSEIWGDMRPSVETSHNRGFQINLESGNTSFLNLITRLWHESEVYVLFISLVYFLFCNINNKLRNPS